MGSQALLNLPKIDFSLADLRPGTDNWISVRTQVQQALETYGCFEAVYSEVPVQLRRAIFPALKELFALPITTKMRNSSPKPFHGYVGQYPQVPLYESMGIDDADVEEVVRSFTALMWLRVMKYKGPQTVDAKLGLNAHTDKNIVTILYQNHDGLEVQTKEGDWIPVAASPDTFIVMVGDSFLVSIIINLSFKLAPLQALFIVREKNEQDAPSTTKK